MRATRPTRRSCAGRRAAARRRSRGPSARRDARSSTPNWGAFGSDGSFYFTESGTWKGRDGLVLVVRGRRDQYLDARIDRLPQRPDGVTGRPGAVGVGVDARARWSPTPSDPTAQRAGGGWSWSCQAPCRTASRSPPTDQRSSRSTARMRSGAGAPTWALQVLGHDPEGTVLAAPTNVVFAGPGPERHLLVPNIGRWHVTRFRVPGLAGVPLFYPTRDQIWRLTTMGEFTGKGVLVTGGALGIGKGIVEAFAREGRRRRHRGRRPGGGGGASPRPITAPAAAGPSRPSATSRPRPTPHRMVAETVGRVRAPGRARQQRRHPADRLVLTASRTRPRRSGTASWASTSRARS